jgi:hypothetical protein
MARHLTKGGPQRRMHYSKSNELFVFYNMYMNTAVHYMAKICYFNFYPVARFCILFYFITSFLLTYFGVKYSWKNVTISTHSELSLRGNRWLWWWYSRIETYKSKTLKYYVSLFWKCCIFTDKTKITYDIQECTSIFPICPLSRVNVKFLNFRFSSEKAFPQLNYKQLKHQTQLLPWSDFGRSVRK